MTRHDTRHIVYHIEGGVAGIRRATRITTSLPRPAPPRGVITASHVIVTAAAPIGITINDYIYDVTHMKILTAMVYYA